MNITSVNSASEYISIDFNKVKKAYKDSEVKKLPKGNRTLNNNLRMSTAVRKMKTELTEIKTNVNEEVKDGSIVTFFEKYNEMKKMEEKANPSEFEKYNKTLEEQLKEKENIFKKIGIERNENNLFDININIFEKSSKEDKENAKTGIKSLEKTIDLVLEDTNNFINNFKRYEKQSSLSKFETGLMYDTYI